MSEERIDIQFTDKVDGNIAKKIDQIADAADRADNYLGRLKSALASVNTSAVDRLASAMAKVDSAQAKLINAQARLTNSQNAGSVAAQRAALAQQKIATEAARTKAAQARAAAASSAAKSAALRLANAQQRQAQTAAAASTAEAALGNSVDAMRAKVAAGEGGIRALVAEQQRLNAANGAAGGALNNTAAGMDNAARAAGQYSRAGRQVNAANANIIAQIQDIGVSLAGGQNPLLVAIQQGSQLSYIATTMEGGMKQLIATIGRMALAWAPVLAVLGAVYFALDQVSSKLNDSAGMDAYIKTLGLTEKEVKKLKDTHVTIGDTIKATWQVLSENLLAAAGLSTDQIKTFWSDTADWILKWMKYAFLGIGAGTVTLVKAIIAIVGNIGKIFYNAGVAAKNLFLMSIEFLVNKTIDGINAIGSAINMIGRAAGFGDIVGQLQHVDLGVGSVKDGMMELTSIDLKGWFREGLAHGQRNLTAIGDRAKKIAKKRIADQAANLISDRPTNNGPNGHNQSVAQTAENPTNALDMVNTKLDDELKRMNMLKGEREIQQRMDQIEEGLAQKKIKLNDEERAAIEKKVRAIEDFKKVQAEMDRIYTEITGPMETYKATLGAITELQSKGAISADQAAQQQVKANRAYQEATDPLFQMKESLDQQERTLGLYGDALNQANYYEQIRQNMLKDGIILSGTYVAGVNAEVDALMRRNAAIQQSQYIQDQAGQFINPALDQAKFLENYQTIYDEINRLRQTDLENEGAYQQALYGLQAKYNEMRLSGYSDFFGALADVTKNGHGIIGGISKAAAVAQATIDGYVAVQKALASLPPPFSYAAAAAVAIKTGAQIAGIVSTNAGSFATGGQFIVDGKSGVDANNINMNVTRGERVTIETPAQQRATDVALAGGGAAPQTNLKVVNVIDPREALASIDTAEGEQVIINIIERNAPTIQKLMGSR